MTDVAFEMPCDPPVTQEDETRLAEGDLVENLNVSLSEGGAKEHGEGETGDKNKDETPIQTEFSRVATQSGDEHLLLSTIEQVVVDPATQCTTQLSHSMVSQQTMVSTSHGDLAQLVPTTHLESGGTDQVWQSPQPTTSFLSTSSLGPIVHSDTSLSLLRTQIVTSFAGAYSSPAGTSGVTPLFGVSRGPDGSPTMVNTMPAMNVGTTSAGTGESISASTSASARGLTGSLSDPGVSTLPGSSTTVSSSSASTSDLSRIQVTVSAENLITRSLYSQGMKVVANSLKLEGEKQAKLIQDLKDSITANIIPPPPPPRTQTVNDLKTALMAQLVLDGAPEDVDLVRALQRQATIQKSVLDAQREAIDEARRQSQVVTHSDFLALKTSLENKLSDIADTMTKALEALSERVAICEQQCKEPVNPSKRRHEDPDEGGPHEGEKRRRLTDIPQGRSIRIIPLSDREEGSSRGGGRRYLGREEEIVYLAGGEEVTQQEIEQMIQDRNARRELAFSGPELLTNLGVEVTAPETPVYRTDKRLTLGSSQVPTSSSRLDSVEALIESIADSLNQHQFEQEVPEQQREKIAQILDRQVTDTCDVHLENNLEFDFENVDSDTGERVNAPDLLPLDPEKEERLR